MRPKWFMIAPLAVAGMVVFMTLGTVVVRELWNWLTPSLFGWQRITFWQALGILGLCRILFGGFRLHGGGPSRFRHRMAEKWHGMTPEERDRVRRRWGIDPATGAPDAS